MLAEVTEPFLERVAGILDDSNASHALRASCPAGRQAANAAVTELRASVSTLTVDCESCLPWLQICRSAESMTNFFHAVLLQLVRRMLAFQ